MKIIKYIIPVLALILTGCNLDREPHDRIFSKNFWKTQQDAELALFGCYAYLNLDVTDAYIDGYADNNYCQYPWESKATFVSSGQILSSTDFGYNFESIRRFNYFLENIDRIPMSDQLKQQYKAEVRTLRALRYFNLTTRFGPVPLFTKYITTTEEGQLEPMPENEVVNFIVKELEESIEHLPKNPNVKSRLGKAAAYTIKARVHLFYNQWDKVVEATKAIMDMNQYSLFKVTSLTSDDYKDDYSTMVDISTPSKKEKFYKGLRSYERLWRDENKSNSEVILNQEFIEDNFNYISLFLLSANTGGGWSSITPTTELVDAYWTSQGEKYIPIARQERAEQYKKFIDNQPNTYLDEFKNRDTRLYASILYPGAIWNEVLGDDSFVWQGKGAKNTSKTGYNYRKMVDPKDAIDRKANDFPLIRYAEILLMYAEAQNELSGPDNSVYQAINQIRERVAMPEVTAGLNQSQMREVIRNERRIELANEGHRWNDIRRWGISNEVMKDIYNIEGEKAQERSWSPLYNRLPYPTTAIDRNPKLKSAQTQKGY